MRHGWSSHGDIETLVLTVESPSPLTKTRVFPLQAGRETQGRLSPRHVDRRGLALPGFKAGAASSEPQAYVALALGHQRARGLGRVAER